MKMASLTSRLLIIMAMLQVMKVSCGRTIIVSQNADGHFTTIGAALNSIRPTQERTTILIKRGIYREQVTVGYGMGPITFQGEGPGLTSIVFEDTSGSSNNNLGLSATLGVDADWFIARDLTVNNIAPDPGQGSIGKQAVALRVVGDKAAFYNVHLLSFQDTLFDAHGRHYYESCYIAGNIDFICGNARSLFYKCTIASRSTFPGGIITAQKRMSPIEKTGFLFKDCKIIRDSPHYRGTLKLGRAWGPHALVIFQGTTMDNVVDPDAWDNWKKPPQNLHFIEVGNRGLGAKNRRSLPFKPSRLSNSERVYMNNPFGFIDGQTWLGKV